jgi:cob(I)alamin adenosyltransferase
MKIYTGSGDRGTTSLFSGERVPKNHARIDAFGTLDELNSVLGALIAALPAGLGGSERELEGIQQTLLAVGAWLAVTPGAPEGAALQGIDPEAAAGLERAIDRMDAGLPPLASFILPGGDPAAAWAHVARTVCRRAERLVAGLCGEDAPEPFAEQLGRALVFLNRLSDYLFVLARHVNSRQGRPERLWKP